MVVIEGKDEGVKSVEHHPIDDDMGNKCQKIQIFKCKTDVEVSKYPTANDESGKVTDSINEETENVNHNEFEGNESLNAES